MSFKVFKLSLGSLLYILYVYDVTSPLTVLTWNSENQSIKTGNREKWLVKYWN